MTAPTGRATTSRVAPSRVRAVLWRVGWALLAVASATVSYLLLVIGGR